MKQFLIDIAVFIGCMAISTFLVAIIAAISQVFFHWPFSEFRNGFWVASFGWIFYYQYEKWKDGRAE